MIKMGRESIIAIICISYFISLIIYALICYLLELFLNMRVANILTFTIGYIIGHFVLFLVYNIDRICGLRYKKHLAPCENND